MMVMIDDDKQQIELFLLLLAWRRYRLSVVVAVNQPRDFHLFVPEIVPCGSRMPRKFALAKQIFCFKIAHTKYEQRRFVYIYIDKLVGIIQIVMSLPTHPNNTFWLWHNKMSSFG
jgi:hypothetical protein